MVKEAKRPKFVKEDWIDSALIELNTRSFTPAQYEAYMRHKVQQADAKKADDRRLKRQNRLGKIERDTEIVTNLLLNKKMSVQEIHDLLDIDTVFIEAIKAKLTL